ncbi:MAG: tetratricopeptide repeat protein [Bacteroidales bacterium]|nr:tetratricopeptide repeat protein [Bacteroidales bacterium]
MNLLNPPMRKIILFITFLVIVSSSFSQVNTRRFLAMGRTDLFNDNYTESIKNLTIAIKAAPDKFEPYFFRGLAKYSLGDYDGAISDFSESIEINPYFSYNYQYRGICKSQLHRYYDALKDFADAIHRGPNNADVYVNRGTTKLQLDMYEQSIHDFDTAIILDKKNELAFLNKGLALYKLSRMEEALDEINKAIRINYLNKLAYQRRGMLKFEMEKYADAIFDFELAMKLDNEDPLLYFFRGLSRYNMGDTLGTYSDYAKVLKLDPNNALTYYNRAILKTEQKKYKSALRDLNKVVQINKGNIYGWYNRGVVKFLSKNYRGAEKDFTKAIELFPDFAQAYLNRSGVRRELKDDKGAYTDIEKAEEIRNKFNNMPADSIPLLYKDSIEFTKLIAFQSDFNNANSEDGYIQFKNVYVQLESNFIISMLANDEEKYIEEKRSQYFVQEIAEYNESKLAAYKLSFGLTKEVNTLSPKKSSEILKRMDTTLVNNPNNPYNYLYIGILNERLGNLAAAQESYSNAVNIDPTFGFAYLNLANVLYLNALEKVERNRENEPNIIIGEMEDQPKKKIEYMIPDLDLAINYYNQALQIYPELGFLYYNRGNLYNKMQNYMMAIEDYDKAISLQPNMAEAYYNKGLTLLLLKDNENACPNLSKAGELGITPAYNLIKRYCIKK